MKWLKKGCKFGFYFILGYTLHIFLEAFIVANALAIFGLSIPVIL